MVVNFCGLRLGPSPRRSSHQKDTENEKCGLTASVAKFLKPRSCSWAAMKAKKRPPVHPPEVQLYEGNNSKTLKALIASSPGEYSNMSGGEMGGHKHPSSRKIHPSFDGELIKEDLLVLESGLGFSVSKRNEAGNSSVGNGKGKMKKKVSFRSPEVAQVFVLDRYSPEMHMCTVGQ